MAIPVQLGIVVGVYLGTRLWRRWRVHRQVGPGVVEPGSPSAQPLRIASADEPLADHLHQLRVSLATLAGATLGYWLYPPLALVNVALLTYTSVPILLAAEDSLRREGKIRNDSLSALTSLLCLATGNLFAGAANNTVFHLSCRLVQASKEQSRTQLRAAFLDQPDNVWVMREGVEIELPLARVQAGDGVVVHTGELIPVDGKILDGHALIDQQSLTGEARPAEKHTGDTVYASTLVVGGRLLVEATRSGADSQAQRLNELLTRTEDFKTSLQLRGEQWADRVSLPVMGVSALAWPLLGFPTAVAMLFSAPTNTVRSLLSLQTATHMQWAAERGILIRDGRVLEELLRVDTILFDKTGTLTESQPEVERIVCCGHLAPEPLLAYAASAEQHLHHPIASALLAAAEQRGLLLPPTRDNHYHMGLGVSVRIGSREVHVGSPRFIQQLTGEERLPGVIRETMREAEGNTFILVAVDGAIQGAIELSPQLRPEVVPLIRELRLRGFRRLGLVSGDLQAPTERLARQLGLDLVYAETMPQDKAALIRRLQAQGHRVCFVGDGLNDALAMKQANVSVCSGGGAELTRDAAQMVLLNERLGGLCQALDMSAHLHLRLAGSLGFWMGFGATNLLGATLLRLGPLQSSVFYGVAFSLGLRHARSPGLLERLPLSHSPREADDDARKDIVPGTIFGAPGPEAL